MCKIICVTNRLLSDDFLKRIRQLGSLGIPVILREKDLSEPEYGELAKKAMELTDKIILHTYINTARELGADSIHLPLAILETSSIQGFKAVGASVHSVDEAIRAQQLGASYITAGHVFATDCKKGVPPRGLDFLRNVCRAVDIPVYAIGGINPHNACDAVSAGASGICVMSSFMTAPDVRVLYNELLSSISHS